VTLETKTEQRNASMSPRREMLCLAFSWFLGKIQETLACSTLVEQVEGAKEVTERCTPTRRVGKGGMTCQLLSLHLGLWSQA